MGVENLLLMMITYRKFVNFTSRFLPHRQLLTFLLLVQKKSNKRKRQHQQSLFYAWKGQTHMPPAYPQAKKVRAVAAPPTAHILTL
jgi:hypothetical protein